MVYLFGAGGHAKVLIEIAEANGITDIQIFDDNGTIKKLLGYKVNPACKIESKTTDCSTVVAVGNNMIRHDISKRLKGRFRSLIHPKSYISNRTRIGDGTVVMAGVTVNSGSIIGNHAILNTNCSIDHDCKIADFVHISPNVALAGGVSVGEGTHIGIGSSVIPGVRIGKWSIIGAGSVIIGDIPDNVTVVGNPGRIIKSNFI